MPSSPVQSGCEEIQVDRECRVHGNRYPVRITGVHTHTA
jgi:hypothetical protein